MKPHAASRRPEPAPATPAPEGVGAREDGRVVRARALKSARRSQILAAARMEFARRGYQATSVSDLLEAAGIARGTFYLHFDGKEAAFRAVLEELLSDITAGLQPVDTRSLHTAREQLVGNIARAFSLIAEAPELGALLFHHAGGVSQELRAHLDAFFSALAALAERSIRAGQALGLVRAGDAALLSRLALGLLKEAAQRLTEPAPPTPTALAQQVLELALGGLIGDRARAAVIG